MSSSEENQETLAIKLEQVASSIHEAVMDEKREVVQRLGGEMLLYLDLLVSQYGLRIVGHIELAGTPPDATRQ